MQKLYNSCYNSLLITKKISECNMSSLNSVPATVAPYYQYHEAVADRAWARLTDAQKNALLKFLPESTQSELQKENMAYLEFFTDLPEEILSSIFSYLSKYQAFVCHAVCKRFFNNDRVVTARNQLANSVVNGFYRQKYKNFDLLTQEVRNAVRVLDFTQPHFGRCFPEAVEAVRFPHVDTVHVKIRHSSLSTIFGTGLRNFADLKTVILQGNDGCGVYDNYDKFSLLPKSIENLTFDSCHLYWGAILQIPKSFTSLKSLKIINNSDDDSDDDNDGALGHSLNSLPTSLEELHIPGDSISNAGYLSHLTKLRSLTLHELDGTAGLSRLPTSLTKLSVTFFCSIPEKLNELTHLVNLKELEMGGCKDIDAMQLPPCLASLLKQG